MIEVQFNATKFDRAIVMKIAQRAHKALPGRSIMDWAMDVEATHCNGNPLRLADLLAADGFSFLHDMTGICRHLDRDTGQLNNHFLPRFSAPTQADAA